VAGSKIDASTASVELRWTAPEDTGVPLTGYILYQIDVATGIESIAYDGSTTATVLSTIISGLVLDADYQFYVTALNPIESEPSDVLTIRAGGLPEAPSTITASTSHDSLELTWSTVTNDGGSPIIDYAVFEEIYTGEGEITNEIKIPWTTATTARIDGLARCVSYVFSVKSATAVGESPYSARFAFETSGVPTPPLNLNIESYDQTKISLSWEASLFRGCQAITGWNLYRNSIHGSSIRTLLVTKPAAQTTHVDVTVT
jgi:hypothetical protein